MKVFFETKGHGHPLILLHGFCETHHIWDHLILNLPDGIQTLAPDLPGFGGSEPLPAGFGLEKIADEMLCWIEGCGTRKPVLLGHSLGGYVALAMMAMSPGSFSGLALLNSTALPDSSEKKASRSKVLAFVDQHGVQKYVESFIPDLFYQRQNPHINTALALARATRASTFKDYTLAMRDRPSREEVMRTAEVPISLMAGEFDPGIPLQSMRELARLNQSIRLHILPKTAHMGMFESTGEVVSIIENLVSEARSGADF